MAPAVKPSASMAKSSANGAHDPPSWPFDMALSITSVPALMTSQKMNSRMPAENIVRKLRVRFDSPWTRPSGSPRKMVAPANAPSSVV